MANINKIRLSGQTYNIQDLSAAKTVELTQAQYDALVSGGTVDTNTFYVITDAEGADLSNYYTKSETSGATEISTALNAKADTATTYTKTEVDNAITAATSTKQDTLVSGTNIKTINNESLLGSGNITIQGGGSGSSYTAGDGIDITNDVISVTGKTDSSAFTAYTAATDTALASKQTTLTAGTNITIVDNVISATGGGGGITSGEVETMIEDYMSIDVNATLFTATITASSIYITNGEITNVWSQGYDIPRYINYTDEFRIAGDRSYNISALNLTQSFKDIYGNFDSSTVKGLGIIIKKSFYNKIPSQFKVNSGLFPVAKITSPITGMTNAWDVIPSLYNSYDWNNFNGDSWDDVKDDDYLLVWQNFGSSDYHLENYTWGYESRWGVGYTTDSNTWGTYVVMFTTTDYASETPNVPYICPLFDADTWQNIYTGVTYSQTSQKSYDGEDVDSISNTANSALTNANSAMSTANSAMTIAQGAVSSTNLKTVNGTSLVQTGGGNIDVHGDWNENSSGSTSYIKNRPFYMEASSSSECALACVPLDDEEWNMSYGCVETYTIQTTRTFSEGEKLGLAFIYENQYDCEHPQISPQTIVNNSGTLTVGPYNGFTLTSSDGVNWTVTTTNGSFCIQPIIFWNPTSITYHKLDSNFIDSDIARTSVVTAEITAAVSGKVDTSTYNTYTAATDTALNAKQDTLVSGTNIKTINNESILGSGNITIQGGGGSSVNVVQTTGTSTADVMSQDAVTTVINTVSDAIPSTYISSISKDYDEGLVRFVRFSAPSKFNYFFLDNPKINGTPIHIFDGAVSNIHNFSLVETSAITTSVSSSSTDAQIPSAKSVNDKLGGLSLVKLTQTEYDALTTKDDNTVYFIGDSTNGYTMKIGSANVN